MSGQARKPILIVIRFNQTNGRKNCVAIVAPDFTRLRRLRALCAFLALATKWLPAVKKDFVNSEEPNGSLIQNPKFKIQNSQLKPIRQQFHLYSRTNFFIEDIVNSIANWNFSFQLFIDFMNTCNCIIAFSNHIHF